MRFKRADFRVTSSTLASACTLLAAKSEHTLIGLCSRTKETEESSFNDGLFSSPLVLGFYRIALSGGGFCHRVLTYACRRRGWLDMSTKSRTICQAFFVRTRHAFSQSRPPLLLARMKSVSLCRLRIHTTPLHAWSRRHEPTSMLESGPRRNRKDPSVGGRGVSGADPLARATRRSDVGRPVAAVFLRCEKGAFL